MSELFDIFISYRRKDAEAHARMLYKDLTSAGYSAFYDHSSLGGGNFLENIAESIKQCKDFIVLLSSEALGKRINDPNDIMRFEIATAFKYKKRIIGITLTGFKGFPKNLPEEISELPLINCLSSKMEYYDAMLSRLLSGQFLSSQSSAEFKIDDKHFSDKNQNLECISNMPFSQKYPYMQLLLNIMHEFNNSDECMRFYHYIDMCDRNIGIRSLPKYEGDIPRDLVTYLSFFETLYIIIVTKTIDLSVIDEMYRFRFFAACNNPVMQNSELLPLGYQYPNIMELYDLWSEYIRTQHTKNSKLINMYFEIPQFDHDLHKRYHIYQFAHHLNITQQIRLIDRYGNKINLFFKRMSEKDLEEAMNLQNEVVSNIPNNDIHNIFEPLSLGELSYSLKKDIVIGAYFENKLIAFLNLIPYPNDKQNLLLDLEEYKDVDSKNIMVVDCVLINELYRGFGLQSLFLDLAQFLAKHMVIKYLCAVVSPKNPYSAKNFIKNGYRMAAMLPKYHSIREYFILDIDELSK